GRSEIVARSTFTVTDASVHRPFLVTALHSPLAVNTDIRELATTAVVVMGLVALIFFPCAIFEETLDNNYEEVRGWFGRTDEVKERTGRPAVVEFVLFMAVSAGLYTFLDPGAGVDLATVAVFVSLVVGLALAVIGDGVPALIYGRRHGLEAPLRAL